MEMINLFNTTPKTTGGTRQSKFVMNGGNLKINEQIQEFIGRGKYNNPEQQIIYNKGFEKGSNKGYFMGRFLVNDDSNQSRVQAVAQDLNISNYRKKKKTDLVVEIKQKIKDNSKLKRDKIKDNSIKLKRDKIKQPKNSNYRKK